MPYSSIAESYRVNARRHLKNAARHYAAGNLDYANGSIAKAKRQFERASEYERMFGALFTVHPVMQKYVDEMVADVEHVLLYGAPRP